MSASLKEIIQLDPLVAAFRSCALIVHQMPFITSPGRRCVEADVGLHGNGTGSAKSGV